MASAQRFKTISSVKTSKAALRAIQEENAAADSEGMASRPRYRAECIGTERPCPFVSCRHHLYLEVHPETLSIKINRPDVEVHEMTDSCSLDVADSRDATLEDVGNMFSVTRERARQIEGIALEKCKSTLGDVLFWYLDEAEET